MPGFHVWGASVVHWSGDGKFHMFASRWPAALTHYAWVTSSEVRILLGVYGLRFTALVLPLSSRNGQRSHRCAASIRK
jgi:hypothetical protein